MSVELTTAERAKLDGILGTLAPPILTEYPVLSAEKAGQPFVYNGQLWRYARSGEFGTLPEGTPWPAKGYREGRMRFGVSSNFTGQYQGINVLTNDFPGLFDEWTNIFTGLYRLTSVGLHPDSVEGNIEAFGIAVGRDDGLIYSIGFSFYFEATNDMFEFGAIEAGQGNQESAFSGALIVVKEYAPGSNQNPLQ